MEHEQPSSGTVAMDWQRLPAVFLIKTQQGKMGLIRLRPIDPATDSGRRTQRGYWVEYKMVVRATSNPRNA